MDGASDDDESVMRFYGKVIAISIGGLLVILAVTLLFSVRRAYQTSLFEPETVTYDVNNASLESTTITLESEEQCTVMYHIVPDSPYFILWFHGNAGNITTNTTNLALLEALGYSYALIDYPGYGLSTGKPSEENIYASATALYAWAIEQPGVTPDQLVVIGQSLGGAAAIDLATRLPVHRLITMSTLSSTQSVMKTKQLPGWMLAIMPNQFMSINKISAVTIPTLLVHGTKDATVPYEESVQLSAAAPQAQFYSVTGADHRNVIQTLGLDQMVNLLRGFIVNGKLTAE